MLSVNFVTKGPPLSLISLINIYKNTTYQILILKIPNQIIIPKLNINLSKNLQLDIQKVSYFLIIPLLVYYFTTQYNLNTIVVNT